MSSEVSPKTYNPQGVFRDVVHILDDMTSDWDNAYGGGIQPDTRLIADLGFESVDVVQLIVAIEEHFQRRDLPFVELVMQDGRYVEEMRVGDIVDFLTRHLNPAQ